MSRLLKFWSLPRREKQRFAEAAILLLLSHLSVKTIAFRRINGFLRARWINDNRDVLDAAEDIKLTKLSLSRVVNQLPWQGLCLSRSMAAFIMLRRRGIPAVIVAGVRFSEGSALQAHAWLDTGHAQPDANSNDSIFTVVLRIGQEPSLVDAPLNTPHRF